MTQKAEMVKEFFCWDIAQAGIRVFINGTRLGRAEKKNSASEIRYGALEVPPRFELGNESFADSCLTTWPRYRMKIRNAEGVPYRWSG